MSDPAASRPAVASTPPDPHDLRTKGEANIWLTALGLTLGLLMVTGLLLVIAVRGISVFWPKPVFELVIETEPGQQSRIAGELVKTQPRKSAGGPPKEEAQFFLGNKEAYGIAFRFVDTAAIRSRQRPAALVVAERMEFGDSIFYPVSLTLKNGDTLEASNKLFDKTLRTVVREANRRRREILDIEKGEIGAINARIQSLQAKIRTLEDHHSAPPGNKDTQLAALREQVSLQQAAYEKLAAESRALRDEHQSAQLRYRLASGEERSQPAGDLVYYYYPNQLSVFGKLGVFFHRATEFMLGEPREANTEGGIFPAIFGTFVMTILMAVMVTPFGVVAAIYLREYARQGLLVRIVRICVNNLAGVPSIVFGVFGLGFFVYGVGSFIDGGPASTVPPVWWLVAGLGFIASSMGAIYLAVQGSNPSQRLPSMKLRPALKAALTVAAVLLGVLVLTKNPYFHGFFRETLPAPTFGTGGILWASLTLALMTLPVVIVATEEALAAVPRGVREAALACGASKWQMIQRVVLPCALPGVMTGVILAMARGAGEVAPLMITGVVKLAPSLPLDFTPPFIHADRKFMHLGFHIYDLGFQSPDSEAAQPMVFATTLLLIALVVVMNLFAIRLRTHLQRKYRASAF